MRARTTDESGQVFEQAFTVTIRDDPALSRSGRTLTVTGFRSGVAVPGDAKTIILSPTGYSFEEFDFNNVDQITFTAAGSTDPATAAGGYWLMDDMTANLRPRIAFPDGVEIPAAGDAGPETILGRVAERNVPIITTNTWSDPFQEAQSDGESWISCSAAPQPPRQVWRAPCSTLTTSKTSKRLLRTRSRPPRKKSSIRQQRPRRSPN